MFTTIDLITILSALRDAAHVEAFRDPNSQELKEINETRAKVREALLLARQEKLDKR